MITSASMSTNYMRKLGMMAETLEHRSGRFRKDAFDVTDGLAFSKAEGIIMFQSYRKGAAKAHSHMKKGNKTIDEWIRSGGRFQLHCWNKKCIIKKNGKKGKAKRWAVEVIEVL